MIRTRIPLCIRVLCACGALLVSASNAAAQRTAQSDFNSDGVSDYVLITAGASSLSWSAFSGTDLVETALGEIGVPGDEVVMGDWTGTGTPQIGVVSGDSDTGLLNWEIKTGDSVTTATFGDSDATAIAGADFNGDAKTDAGTVELYRNRLVWKLNTNLLANDALTVQQINWGGKFEQPFYASPDGNHDWIATIRRTRVRAFMIRLRDPLTNEVRRIRGTGSFGSGAPVARPEPVKRADGTDLLMTHKAANGVTHLTFVNLTDGVKTEKDLTGDGTVIIGNFTSADGEEVALQTSTGFTVYNPTTDASTDVAAPTGIAVDEININRVLQSRSGDGDGGGAPPSGGTGPGLDLVCATRSAISIGELLIKSEISNHIHPGDARATGYTLVCARQCPKNLRKTDFFYSDGSYAGSVGYYGRFSGNGQPRLYGAAGGAPQHFARQIAQQAAQIGNGKLYMQMSSATTGAETSCKEFNGTGRNGGL